MNTLRSARHFLARLRRLPQQRAALRDGTGIRIQQTMRYAEAWRAQTDWETPLEFFRRPDFTQLGLPARIAPLGETDAAAFLWSTTLEYCDQFVLQRRNCGFTPWGLTFIDRDGTLVEELNVWFPMGSESPELADFYAQQVFIGKPLPGRSLFLTAPAAQNYSHWLLDVVPSFHLLELTGVEVASFDRVISNRVDLAFQTYFWEKWGVSASQLHALGDLGPVRAEVGCFTSRPLFRQGITPPWAVRYLRSLILPEARPAKPSRRILLLRKDEKKRPLANAAELEAALAPHGFVSVEPAKLSVTEQARLFAEAEAIIAVHGAALANLVFASAGTHVLEILPLGPRLGPYRILADRVGALYDCVFGNGPLGDKDAALVVDPVTITSAVSQWSLTAKQL